MQKNEYNKKYTKEENKNQTNVLSYAVIMIISVIIIILIASIADNREKKIDNKIMETENYNQNIENQLVNLETENYKLNKTVEKLTSENEELKKYKSSYDIFTNVWNLYNLNDINGATTLVKQIDFTLLDENQKGYYTALCKLLNIDTNTNISIIE